VTPDGIVILTDTGNGSLAPEDETLGVTVYVTGAPIPGEAEL
jgi:hypothetical protein